MVIFSLKKQPVQFSFSPDLYFQQKDLTVLNFSLIDEKLCLNVNRRNDFLMFQQYYKAIIYIFNIISKNTLESLPGKLFFE